MYQLPQPSKKLDKKQKQQIINKSFEMYANMDKKCQIDRENLIIQLLKLCMHYKHPDKVSYIWNDIKTLNQSLISISLYKLFIQCCIDANNINIKQCINALQWIQHDQTNTNIIYVELHGSQITKLIQKCNNIHSLLYIDKLLKQQFIKSNDQRNNIIIQTALINAYGKHGNISNALELFHSINNCDKNIVCYRVMMSILIRNNQNKNAFEIYKNIGIKKDVSLDMLAVKACTNDNNFEIGERIIESNKLLNKYIENDKDYIRLKTTLINFYGQFKDINKAINIFDSININQKDIVIINAMIKAYGMNECIQKGYDLFKNNRLIANKETYLILLSGVGHSEFDVNMAVNIWENEIIDMRIKYDLLVMTALIDGFSRKGYVYMAYEYIVKYNEYHEIKHKTFDVVMYTSLLSGCRQINNKQLCEYIYKQIEGINMSVNRRKSVDLLMFNTGL